MAREIIFISGKSGTGKSTVCMELLRREYSAIDLDRGKRLTFWRNRQTGEISRSRSGTVDPDFFKSHQYQMDIRAVWDAISQLPDERVFLCGNVGNRDEFKQHCRKSFYLKCSPQVLLARLNNPDRRYAKTSALQKMIMESPEDLEFEQSGLEAISADASLEAVVDEIIRRSIAS